MRALGDRFPTIAIVAALVLAGVWLGRSTAPASHRELDGAVATQPNERTNLGRAHVVRVPGGPGIEDIRAEIRAEIRAALRDELDLHQSQPREGNSEALASEPSAEQQEVLDRGHAVLDDIIDGGRLSAVDHRELDDLLAQLPTAHKRQLLSRLFVAINDQQVVPDMP